VSVTAGDRGTIGGVGAENSLWRAIALFRGGAWAYALYLTARDFNSFERPTLGWIVVAGMGISTAFAAWAYAAPSRRRWPMLAADLVVAGASLYASAFVIHAGMLAQGGPTLPMAWVAAPVLAFAVAKGRWYALASALVLFAVDGLIRGFANDAVIDGLVLLVLAGLAFGYLNSIAVAAERRMQQATQLEAANRERERLARTIHDSVLQALALVERRGGELGGPAADLGRLAGEQGTVLRTLVAVGSADPASDDSGAMDLRALLSLSCPPAVSMAMPATPVALPVEVASEVQAAVLAALANVSAHAGTGARAFILVEDEGNLVTVTVRDDGLGMAAERLAEAEAAGRLGVAQSIVGRIRDVAGTVKITSQPGAGTEVEMRVPRPGRLRRPQRT
jgi:signal transduction histidine kinase